ncbi:hypothetical protein ACFL3H_08900 [Gemmatimonadota bacterium]
MTRQRTTLILLSVFSGVSLLCWLVMFLAGTDVWHFTGRPDFWNLEGAPHADLRTFSYAFYLQLMVLVAVLGSSLFSLIRMGKIPQRS